MHDWRGLAVPLQRLRGDALKRAPTAQRRAQRYLAAAGWLCPGKDGDGDALKRAPTTAQSADSARGDEYT
jgi:hypothetical protein